jgi:hypothetical protein
MDAVAKGLRDRAVIVAKKTQAFVMERLTSVDGLDPGKLMETAVISMSMAEKVTKADGLVNAALSDGFVQLSVYCLARVAVTKSSEHGEIRRRWSEILGLKSPCSATSFLIRYVSEDDVVASQRTAIEQLGKDANYQAAVFGVGDLQPDHGRKMAGSPAWRQLVETGRTQVLLRVVFPALLDFAASGNRWEFLSTADDAAFLGVLSAKASKYAFPLMQVRGEERIGQSARCQRSSEQGWGETWLPSASDSRRLTAPHPHHSHARPPPSAGAGDHCLTHFDHCLTHF